MVVRCGVLLAFFVPRINETGMLVHDLLAQNSDGARIINSGFRSVLDMRSTAVPVLCRQASLRRPIPNLVQYGICFDIA